MTSASLIDLSNPHCATTLTSNISKEQDDRDQSRGPGLKQSFQMLESIPSFPRDLLCLLNVTQRHSILRRFRIQSVGV